MVDESGAQVLTLTGKAIDWTKPPKPTDLVMWSRKTSGGKSIIGSLRTIAWLDRVDSLAFKRWGKHITVIQSCYNTGVAASAGTHDYDACLDVQIDGVDWDEAERFFRENGAGAYHRTPAQGFSHHIHLFVLPPREGVSISDDYRVAGFKVGKYVDGGWSLYGRAVASSQIEDYYNHRNALAGHAADTHWFPADITRTIFDLDDYIARRKKAAPVSKPKAPSKTSARIIVATNNIMALPKNPKVRETLLATPRASVLLVQEGNLIAFKKVMAALPGYKVAGSLHTGKGSVNYSNFVLYKPDVWEHVRTEYVKEYDGVDKISNTRHIAVAILRHKVLNKEFAFLSFHAVTKGQDKNRVRMRKAGLKALRKQIGRMKAAKMPIIVGGDYNHNTNAHPTAKIRTAHGIDQQYAWSGGGVTITKDKAHTVKTHSDHDALVVEYIATK